MMTFDEAVDYLIVHGGTARIDTEKSLCSVSFDEDEYLIITGAIHKDDVFTKNWKVYKKK